MKISLKKMPQAESSQLKVAIVTRDGKIILVAQRVSNLGVKIGWVKHGIGIR